MKKAWITMLSSVLILVLLLTGCGDAGDTTTDAQTNRTDVIIAQAGDAPSMDPHNCYDSLGMRVYMNIFEGLLHADETGKLEPALAESYEISEDGLVYTFHLRQGVTFQNGDSLTAEDVKFSLDRASDSPYCAEAADPIDSTAIIDAQTIAVTLKYAYEAQLPFFATTYLSIVSQKVVEEQGEDFSVNPGLAGTGPYVFKAWDKGVSVTLERNESYWGEKPFMQKVVYQNITEASAGDIAVESGDVDVYVHPSTADISTMESGDKVKVYQNASYYIEYLGFNMAVKPFDDVRVRQAISMCFDAN
ncbi:MAG: ABC transporter substrate-binding protein, partial [Oscillospiraceae bacterium]